MTEVGQIYKCDTCGNIVEVLHAGDGQLVCCGKPMRLLKAGESDGAAEKHVPVAEARDNGVHVKVGSVRHPMEAKHHIEWIEVLDGDRSHKRFLTPDDEPEAFFEEIKGPNVTVRAYCDLHGLYKSELKK